MIVRFNVKCLTCDTAHTLRMQMGHNRTQTHEVICSNCQEVFRVALDIDFDKTTYKARCIDNCEHSALEGKVVNIDPSSPIPKSSLHQDHYFPWLEHARKDLKIDKLISGIKSNKAICIQQIGFYPNLKIFIDFCQNTIALQGLFFVGGQLDFCT